jgi:hypothetical protein
VFAVKLDESIDASGKCQVPAIVKFEENSDIIEHFRFRRELTIKSGHEIFGCVNAYIEDHEIIMGTI